MLWAARLGGHLGPLPSTLFFVLGGSCLGAGAGTAVLSPAWAQYPLVPTLEIAGLAVAGVVLVVIGWRRRDREHREAAEQRRRVNLARQT